MFEEGCHLIDRAVDLFGKPKRVSGVMQHSSLTLNDGLADNTLAILEYDKVLVDIAMQAFQPHGNNYRTFELSGTNGKAFVQPYAKARLLIDLKEAAGPYKAGDQMIDPTEPVPAYSPDFLEFARVVREGAKPSFSAEHDLIVQDTLLRVCGMHSS
jgi:predicted dehydrogenase